jgi:hypothetical protein
MSEKREGGREEERGRERERERGSFFILAAFTRPLVFLKKLFYFSSLSLLFR